ncbi:hypothetical protein OROGR_000451 [Orobanche gracilis]
MCCTIDNASANDGTVRYISDYLDSMKTNILSGQYFHLRCVAHIINLIVSNGSEEITLSVRRVREDGKWVKASPKRSDKFNKVVKAFVSSYYEKSQYHCDWMCQWGGTRRVSCLRLLSLLNQHSRSIRPCKVVHL